MFGEIFQIPINIFLEITVYRTQYCPSDPNMQSFKMYVTLQL